MESSDPVRHRRSGRQVDSLTGVTFQLAAIPSPEKGTDISNRASLAFREHKGVKEYPPTPDASRSVTPESRRHAVRFGTKADAVDRGVRASRHHEIIDLEHRAAERRPVGRHSSDGVDMARPSRSSHLSTTCYQLPMRVRNTAAGRRGRPIYPEVITPLSSRDRPVPL